MKKTILLKFNIIISLLAFVFIASACCVAYYYIDSMKTKNVIVELREQIDREDVIVIDDQTNTEVVSKELTDAKKLENYQELYKQNNDMVGWIYIEGTDVDFPIMQTKNNKEYYLYRSFTKQYSVSGCPFVQYNCDVNPASDNIIIHGHHRSDGTMFAPLLNYKKSDFYAEHKIIEFDTLSECHSYEVLAVFTVKVNTGNDEFKYYNFINAANEAEFNGYVNECLRRSVITTGVTASYGDKLLTISTCDFSVSNGRLVVVAKLID